VGYKTKIQMVNRKYSKQYYVSIPSALAQTLEIRKGEEVEWKINRRGELVLKRGGRNV
jgi:bifunctional DNA-binding transcriptional regulator/antitoxin component of YhaV-PrlF toxin-antitoxin module